MAKNNKIMLMSLLSIFAIAFALTLVSATTTIVTPVANGNYSTSMTINVTTDLTDALNVTLYYNASGGAATTVLTTIVNNTASDTEFTGSATLSSLTQSGTYNITAMADNETDQEYAAAVASITVDYTAPVCTSAVSIYYVELFGPTAISCTCTDNVDTSVTYLRRIAKPSGATVSLTTSPETVSGESTNQVGLYTVTCQATDNAANTKIDTKTFQVQTDESAEQQEIQDEQQEAAAAESNKTRNIIIVAIVLIMLMIAAAWYYNSNN